MSAGRREVDEPVTEKAADAPEKLVKVTPAGNWQIGHGGEVAGPGESLTVPEDVADRWKVQRLVE